MLLSHSKELGYQGDCIVPFKKIYSYYSKIIFIDLNNFKEIKSNEVFQQIIEVIELEKIIIIQKNNIMNIYDIDSLDMIKNMIIDERYNVYSWPDGLYKFSKYDN